VPAESAATDSPEVSPVISVVMPAYNEAAFLERAVRDVAGGLRSWNRPFEIRVIENGSTDGTRTIALRLAAEIDEVFVHWLTSANYGEAVRTGLLESRAPIAVLFDVDFFDLGFLKEALSVLDDGQEPTGPVIVVGSKRAPGSHDDRSPLRRLATGVFTGILRFTFELDVSDTHGMKVLRRDVLDPLIRTCVFGVDLFDTELIIRAERAGWRDAEVPVTVSEQRPARTPMLNRVPRTLLGIAKLRMVLGRHAQ
jgi:glycosyltransferase involved in cell wall biosynthesis